MQDAVTAYDKYHKTPRDMTQVTSDLVKQAKVVIGLGRALHGKGRGVYLQYDANGTRVTFTQKDLSDAQKALYRAIKEVDLYFRYSRKSKRDKITADGFKGVYSPVVLGDVLREFFNDPKFDQIAGKLPALRSGVALRNTLTMLFYLYAHAYNLQQENGSMIRPDGVMNRVFGSMQPLYTSVREQVGYDNQGRPKYQKRKTFAGAETRSTYAVMEALARTDPKIPQAQAALAAAQAMPENDAKSAKKKEKAIKKAQREILRRSFTPAMFASFNFQVLAGLNYAGKAVVEDPANQGLLPVQASDGLMTAADALSNPTWKGYMLSEHAAVKELSQVYRDRRLAQKAAEKAAGVRRR
jgi:hypothetical protein